MDETTSLKLARFLAAQEVVNAAKAELKEVEERARRLRGQLSIYLMPTTALASATG